MSKFKIITLGVFITSTFSAALAADGLGSLGAAALVTPNMHKSEQDSLYPIPMVGYEGDSFWWCMLCTSTGHLSCVFISTQILFLLNPLDHYPVLQSLLPQKNALIRCICTNNEAHLSRFILDDSCRGKGMGENCTTKRWRFVMGVNLQQSQSGP